MSITLTERMNFELLKEYKQDIIGHYKGLERSKVVDPMMIDAQTEIKWSDRPQLINLLLQVHSCLDLCSKSIFSTIQLMDQYTSKRVVMRDHLELVGLTCLWIASKNYDNKNKVITLKELVSCTNKGYSESLFLKVEIHILGTLNWNVHQPTMLDCLEMEFDHEQLLDEADSGKCRDSNEKLYLMAKFLCQLTWFNRSLQFFSNSMKSVGCIMLAASILNDEYYLNKFKVDFVKNGLKRSINKFLSKGKGKEFNFEFNTAFVQNFSEDNVVELKKIILLLVNMLVGERIPIILKKIYKNYSGLKVSALLKNFMRNLDNSLHSAKYNPTGVYQVLYKNVSDLNRQKFNFAKADIKSLLLINNSFDLGNLIIKSALGIDLDDKKALSHPYSTSTLSTINKRISALSLDIINTSMESIDSPFSTPNSSILSPAQSIYSSNSSLPSLCSSSGSVLSDNDSSIGAIEEKPLHVIKMKDDVSEDEYPISPYKHITPKILDFSGKNTTVTSDPIKERKRFFDSEDQCNGSKRHSPNLKSNYSHYFS